MEREEMTEIEFILDRLCEFFPVVVQEIVATSRAQLLQAGLESKRVTEVANCEQHLRIEIAEKGDLVHAIVSRVEFQSLEQGLLCLVDTPPNGQQKRVCRSIEEILPVARNFWDMTDLLSYD